MMEAPSGVIVVDGAVLWRVLAAASATGMFVGAGGIVMFLLSDGSSCICGYCTPKGFMTATGRCWLLTWEEKTMGLIVSSVGVFDLVLTFSVDKFCENPWFVFTVKFLSITWCGLAFLPARRLIWLCPIYDQYLARFSPLKYLNNFLNVVSNNFGYFSSISFFSFYTQGVRQLLYDRETVDRGRRAESNGFWNIKIA